MEKGLSPSRFELETLSVLDSRDNRLHHGDPRRQVVHLLFICTCRALQTTSRYYADANKENVDKKGKGPLRAEDGDATEETDEPNDDEDEDEGDAKEGDAGDMQVR